MIRYTIILILLLSILPRPALSQVGAQIDSLENLLDEATPEERVSIFCQISEAYWQRSFDTSLLMAIHAHNIAKELDKTDLMGKSLYMIGNAYFQLGDYPRSMDYSFQALHISEQLGDSLSLASTYNNIGAIYLNMKNEKKALEYLKKAGKIFNAIGNEARLFAILNNMGAVYVDTEILDTAYQYFQEAYEIAERSGSEISKTIALTNLGEVTRSMGLYKQSEVYQKEAYNISQRLGDKNLMASVSLNLGDLYLQLKQMNLALKFFQESLVLAREINSLPIILENARHLSEYYSLKEDYKAALRFYKMYSIAQDSMISQEGMMQIKELELKFSARALEQEIELLKLDNEIQNLKGTRLKYGIITLVVVLLALMLLFVVYFQRNRFKKETTRILEDKNQELEKANKKLKESEKHLTELNSTKDKFFSIIGHDLRNPLNALLGFSELISGNSREYSSEEIQKYSKIINEAAKNIHLLIENLLEWSRSQSGNIEFNPREDDLLPIVRGILKIFEIQAEKKSISINMEIAEGTRVFADRNLLSTILRNLINNAIKYSSKNGKVIVSATGTDEGVSISIKDSGVGMNEEQLKSIFSLDHGPSTPGTAEEKGTGLGLILCKEFVDKHGGRIWAESESEHGSIFSLILPNQQ
ncbi:tetratricopeptide repeat protein [Bacteroidota bacterium]